MSARWLNLWPAPTIGITDKDVERAGELFNEPEYRAGWDGQTRSLYELSEDAAAIDPVATDAISNAAPAMLT